MLRVSLLIHHKRGLLRLKRGPATDQFREGFALLLQFSERIENGQLPRRVQQRLMVMRPVDVHQPFANRAERLQRGG